ncbi:hypothetical protein L1049_016720 [Liquidambar formosana]|uniref:Uncharacterized protein n=1 Tax=Liquidambar formosana TaxID=63359 RepID=A0AAP0RZX1_LIQFO
MAKLGQVVSNKQVILRNYATGFPKETDLMLSTGTIHLEVPEGSNAVLVKNLYLSCDPYMVFCMLGDDNHSIAASVTPGSVMNGYGVAKVLDSRHPDFKKGDLIWGTTGWEEYSLITTPETFKIEHTDLPLSYSTGILGMPGLSAYTGFFEICSPKKGESVFISAASGAVGQLVGQFLKLMGCYVVGSAGSKEKVDLLRNKFGFDEAFNYKEERDLDAALKSALQYESPWLHCCVRNDLSVQSCSARSRRLDVPYPQAYSHGRIYRCRLLSSQLQVFGHGAALSFWKIVYVEDIAEGIENGPSALIGLFKGYNIGKKLVVVAHE